MQRPASTRLATRRLIARALAAVDGTDPREIAQRRWRGDCPTVTRSGVAGTQETDWSVSSTPAELLTASVEDSVIGRLGVREAPLRVPILSPDRTLAAAWVGESKGIPAGTLGANAAPLEPRKLGLILGIPLAALESPDRRAEAMIENAVRQSVIDALDLALLDPTNDGTADRPAAITNGAPSVASVGDPVADLLALAAIFPGRLPRASVVTDAQTALEWSLWSDTSGAARFLDCGPRGGSVSGMPQITSVASPRDSSGGILALIDGQGIAAAIEDLEYAFSTETVFEQDTTPSAASDTPSAATATLISAFQGEIVVMRATIRASWARVLPCVAVATGCLYS